MRNWKRIFPALIATVMLFLPMSCSAENGPMSATAEGEETLADMESNEGVTAIILNMNGTDVRATLNDTTTARAFRELLPYTVTVSRGTDDLRGPVGEELACDEAENIVGWKVGEIGWYDGWFTILLDHEEQYDEFSLPVIGSIDEADLPFVQSLTGSVEIAVRLAEKDGNEGNTMNIIVGGTVLTATLADNSSAEALKELLADGPLTIDMSDYAAMEKVGSLGRTLPRNDENITTEAGDLILYQGSALVIYYAPNTWSFTRLGRIEGVTQQELIDILGDGNVTVTLEIE